MKRTAVFLALAMRARLKTPAGEPDGGVLRAPARNVLKIREHQRLRQVAARRLPAWICIWALAACAAQPVTPAQTPPGPQTTFSTIPGWAQDNFRPALAAFVRGCKTIALMPPDAPLGGDDLAHTQAGQAGQWQPVCAAANAVSPGSEPAARQFFETWFTPYAVQNQTLVTGYFEPEIPGAKNYAPGYTVPLYAKPADNTLASLPRSAIDAGALNRKAPVTAYVTNPVDAFMLQIQGSGRILLANGKILRVGFNGQNGQPYTPIGRILVQNGDLAADNVSYQTIAAWLRANPGQAMDIMEQNARYVFLKPLGDLPDDQGAPGTLGAPLTAGRSLAVDRSIIPLNTPVFVATTDPITNAPLARLAIAQDTGGGIRGANHVDLFFGAGPDAEQTAGSMRQNGQLFILLPKQPQVP